jgi:hypothetical protein
MTGNHRRAFLNSLFELLSRIYSETENVDKFYPLNLNVNVSEGNPIKEIQF